MPVLRLKPVARLLEHSSVKRKGSMLWSRVMGKNIYLAWKSAPGEPSAQFMAEMQPEQARQLRDWLIEELEEK